MSSLAELRNRIRLNIYADEDECVTRLLSASQLSEIRRDNIVDDARVLVQRSRKNSHASGTLDAFLQEFGLSNKEGVALMCLAEALLRVPDSKTADKLIADKIAMGDWQKHLGHSHSLFVNASTWGLMLTGKIVRVEELAADAHWYEGMLSRVGESLVRNALLQSMKILGGQYVLGRSIDEAVVQGRKENSADTRFSFDMLGEGARTQADAKKYFTAYMAAILTLGKANHESDVYRANGISIKLSALHPRYQFAKFGRVMSELYPSLLQLAKAAKQYNIGLNIDAEEASRLDISLDLFAALAKDEALKNWQGLGFVLQAYQKRSTFVAEWLIELAQQTQRKFMLRLVKGAYWDSEIKHAQELGLKDYPVYTRKANTDLSYQICAQILLDNPARIFPQFATHNAYTLALIKELGRNKSYEFQRLHGMGYLLFEELNRDCKKPFPVRVYAPVGAHKDLLPYLMRRLLENGANSSFVNRFMDESTPVDKLITDVVGVVTNNRRYRHQKIPIPASIFETSNISRENSTGLDLNDALVANPLLEDLRECSSKPYYGGTIVNGKKHLGDAPLYSPAGNTLVGYSGISDADDINRALSSAYNAQMEWDRVGADKRAEILHAIADLMEEEKTQLLALISFEAGRTVADAISELREAVDFCRYYAQLARKHFSSPLSLPGPTGEINELSLHGRGVFICISPWNFPLAIFTGQVVAALVTGNSVIAKPAEQTPLIAAKVVELMHRAGVPHAVLHLITGGAQEGAALVRGNMVQNNRIAGVAFTGSTATAKHIQRALADNDGPIIAFIAETGGLNAMIVDSTALLEQVVDDVISSAFLSAGQRCSSLRVLYVQTDIADDLIAMLCGACEELSLAQPWKLDTDIGPVIDAEALLKLRQHIERMQTEALSLYEYPADKIPDVGFFMGPHIFEIESISQLKQEVFGPILHLIRYDANSMDGLIDSINQVGYGLTLGVHSRIESLAKTIFSRVKVGNTYINRNMVGAVVGVTPFGGQGLSGTGPKAGGPHYLFRFATEKTLTINTVATGGNASLLSLDD